MNEDADLRCFVAVRPSSAQRRAIADGLAALRRDHPAVARELRFVRTDDLHVTLAFLAAVPANEADTLIRAVTVAAEARPSFAWRLGTLGGFPRADRARVAWLGVDGGADELTRLARAVRSALASAGLPFDERSFRPHLTVARARRAPVRLPDGVGIEAPAARVSELVVVRSDLATRGAEHHVLAHLPLAGSADQSGATSNVKTVSDR